MAEPCWSRLKMVSIEREPQQSSASFMNSLVTTLLLMNTQRLPLALGLYWFCGARALMGPMRPEKFWYVLHICWYVPLVDSDHFALLWYEGIAEQRWHSAYGGTHQNQGLVTVGRSQEATGRRTWPFVHSSASVPAVATPPWGKDQEAQARGRLAGLEEAHSHACAAMFAGSCARQANRGTPWRPTSMERARQTPSRPKPPTSASFALQAGVLWTSRKRPRLAKPRPIA